jgi:hypothetical protein
MIADDLRLGKHSKWDQRIKEQTLADLSALQERHNTMSTTQTQEPDSEKTAKPRRERHKFRISTSIPIPEELAAHADKYPFGLMKPGHSILVPKEQSKGATRVATQYGKKHNKTFVYQKSDEGTRIWRVK